MKPDLILRVDGNELMGLGHIYRVYALAGILKSWFNCSFYIQEPSSSIIRMIEDAGFLVSILPATDRESKAFYTELYAGIRKNNELVVLDGYHFNARYQQGLKALGCKLICIDDIYATTFYADAVINHIGGLTKEHYKSQGETSFFLGPDYAILRQEFLGRKENTLPENRIGHLMITLGGADSNNITAKILHSLEPFFKQFTGISVVIGSANQHENELNKYIQQFQNIKLLKNLTAREMYETMWNSGMAICSASTVSYEYAAVGGLLFITQTADNQKDLYKYLLETQLAIPSEKITTLVTSQNKDHYYTSAIGKQREIFDGRSDKRLLSVFLKVYIQGNLQLRKAESADLMIYFNWANDPGSRQNSFSVAPISIEVHTSWFNNKLQDKNAFLYVLESKDGIPVGNIRFELKEGEHVLSYFIDPDFRQLGLARQLLDIGINKFFQDSPTSTFVTGFIKKSNQPSIKAFYAAGFLEETGCKNEILKYKKIKQ
jgi:UDP-2,4-diacetamido-2,4,6-trideoxy-beta-L-altropyranose hydrolase